MEALTRLVSESFARHGFERPLDYRRLKWSRWFRCDSHHSLLFVPSKAGVFAVAEEVTSSPDHVGTAAKLALSEVKGSVFAPDTESRKSAVPRMLAVTQFFEADDMAFVLDRMLSRYNPMRGRLESGRYFVRFVVIEDGSQRRSIHTALKQWILCSAEKNSGIGGHFASSLELSPVTEQTAPPDDSQANLFSSAEMGRAIFSALMAAASNHVPTAASAEAAGQATPTTKEQSSEAGATIHPCPFPSGF